MNATRGSSPDVARAYRQSGHDDALIFALEIGLDKDYRRDPKAKKDVIDLAGDAHSVKSGQKNGRYSCIGETDLLKMTDFRH